MARGQDTAYHPDRQVHRERFEQGTLFTESYPAIKRTNVWESIGERRKFEPMRQQQQNNMEARYGTG